MHFFALLNRTESDSGQLLHKRNFAGTTSMYTDTIPLIFQVFSVPNVLACLRCTLPGMEKYKEMFFFSLVSTSEIEFRILNAGK